MLGMLGLFGCHGDRRLTLSKKMLFKNYLSPSPRRLKVPVNMRFAGVSRGYGGLLTFHIAFTEPSPNLHPLVVKDR